MEGFVDTDYAGDVYTRKSIFGYVFPLFGNVVCWKAILQSMMTLSTI